MADQEQIRELGTVIRNEIRRLNWPPALPLAPGYGPSGFGATEHDIARVAISYFEDAGWVAPDDAPPGEGAKLTSDESSAIYDAYRTGDDALRLQGVVESITQRAYAQGLLDGRKERRDG